MTLAALMTPHSLYRFFDSAGQLLYIGVSVNPLQRWDDHRLHKPWWTEVSSVTLHHYPTRPDVLQAERAAIRTEKPLHNVVHQEPLSSRPSEAGGDLNASLRIRGSVMDRVHAGASRERRSRSQMIRILIEEALDAREATA